MGVGIGRRRRGRPVVGARLSVLVGVVAAHGVHGHDEGAVGVADDLHGATLLGRRAPLGVPHSPSTQKMDSAVLGTGTLGPCAIADIRHRLLRYAGSAGWRSVGPLLADTIPLYPLYALLFADAGLSDGQTSSLFLIWSTVAVVAEVPSGALADRFSRRTALVASGVLQAAGYGLWITVPGYGAFAAGFVVWGLGGAFASGALEALLYDGLASVGGASHYPRLYGRVTAAGLLTQLPTAVAATLLFATGGYPLVGWASVACCLAAAAVATRLPEAPRERSIARTGATASPATSSSCGRAWPRRPATRPCGRRWSRSPSSAGWTGSRSTSPSSPRTGASARRRCRSRC